MKDGQTFKLNNKVYIFTKTLSGYDDYYAREEINRLLSFGLVKRFREGDSYLDSHQELPSFAKVEY